jgi:polyphosphate glucokinase
MPLPEKKKKSVLTIDVGGTNVKILVTGQKEATKIPSGKAMTAKKMVASVKKAAASEKYSCVSIGYPGPVLQGQPAMEPHNLGPGWVAMDYKKAFGCPVKIVNDAALQALGSYEGGRMLFLGLGTGLGSALIVNGVLEPMELAHLPYRDGKTYEQFVGIHGLEEMGKKKWRKHVVKVVEQQLLKKLPPSVQLGDNKNAFKGGQRMWEPIKG